MPEITRKNGEVIAFEPLGTNAICQLEEQTGKVFGEIIDEVGVFGTSRWSLSMTRLFLQACRPSMPLDAIGALIDEVGFDRISFIVNQLILPAQVK